MNTKLFSILASVLGASICTAQLVHVSSPRPDNDPYSRFYDSGRKLTFSGKVSDIKVAMRPSGEKMVTMLVKNSDGGGMATVDLGPQWYLDYQIAKVKPGDKVQVSGSKVVLDGHGLIMASQVLINGQGGLVLALRRPDGNAYWTGPEVAQIPSGSSMVKGTFKSITAYYMDNNAFWAGSLETNLGTLTVDLGPQSLYGKYNPIFSPGDSATLMLGKFPKEVGKFSSLYPTYTIYGKGNPIRVLNMDGTPAYAMSQR